MISAAKVIHLYQQASLASSKTDSKQNSEILRLSSRDFNDKRNENLNADNNKNSLFKIPKNENYSFKDILHSKMSLV